MINGRMKYVTDRDISFPPKMIGDNDTANYSSSARQGIAEEKVVGVLYNPLSWLKW